MMHGEEIYGTQVWTRDEIGWRIGLVSFVWLAIWWVGVVWTTPPTSVWSSPFVDLEAVRGRFTVNRLRLRHNFNGQEFIHEKRVVGLEVMRVTCASGHVFRSTLVQTSQRVFQILFDVPFSRIDGGLRV
ncbi:hypothetical protein IWX90DRAFT_260945 [Phyllosticta citrichinensis]|uniref:Uncharacterized protein n=1 Tax=Phyllosticta citrichinensis TaxID=1130410 RepID=A0ABR1XS21_9PEZI